MTVSPESQAVATYRTSVLPAVAVDGGISTAAFEALREAAAGHAQQRFDIPDRGSYAFCRAPIPDTAASELVDLAQRCVGAPLVCIEQRWTWLRRGDYSLRRDDTSRLGPGRDRVDVTVDISDSACPEAQVVYTHREQAFFSLPQAPGVVGVVALGPTVGRYDRYLTHRVADHVVTRVRLVLEAAQAPRR